MSYTIPQIIQIAKVSQWLANTATANGSLFGQPVDPMLGVKLYVIKISEIAKIWNY